MKEVAVYEAKTRLSELLVEVEAGEQFTITRRGLAVARLVAAEPMALLDVVSSQRTQVGAALSALKALRHGVSLDIPLREALADGRD